jgi:hypothetical protein
MTVISEHDIRWVVSKVWMDGDQALERRLKNRNNGPALCPICRGDVPPGFAIDIKQLTFEKGPPALASNVGRRRPMK